MDIFETLAERFPLQVEYQDGVSGPYIVLNAIKRTEIHKLDAHMASLNTLEGAMSARPGTWTVKEVQGEFHLAPVNPRKDH